LYFIKNFSALIKKNLNSILKKGIVSRNNND
jgi:hypothetical protein